MDPFNVSNIFLASVKNVSSSVRVSHVASNYVKQEKLIKYNDLGSSFGTSYFCLTCYFACEKYNTFQIPE